jgi:hypothetical protein
LNSTQDTSRGKPAKTRETGAFSGLQPGNVVALQHERSTPMTRKSFTAGGVPAAGIRTALALVATATLAVPATALAHGVAADAAALVRHEVTTGRLETGSRATSIADITQRAASSPLLEQHSRGGGSSRGGSGGGGGQAVPRGGGSSGGSSGGRSSGGSTGGGSRAGADSGSGGDRGGSTSGGSARTRDGSGTSGGSARTRDGSGTSDGSTADGTGTPTYSRPRDGRPATGTAVERRRGDGSTVIVGGGGYYGGGLYPWGWGGLGLGGYYGFYDPWGWYDPYPPAIYAGRDYDGALKIKVKPRDAEVYVDGYFAGEVDDYDGAFQKLRLDAGPHRIELRLDGYEPLSFEVRILPDRTITYKGEMKKDQ